MALQRTAKIPRFGEERNLSVRIKVRFRECHLCINIYCCVASCTRVDGEWVEHEFRTEKGSSRGVHEFFFYSVSRHSRASL